VRGNNCDLLTDFHNILNGWKNFCQLVHGINEVRQTEMHTAELLAPEPYFFEVEIAIGKLKRYKSLGIGQILAELIQTGGTTYRILSNILVTMLTTPYTDGITGAHQGGF
jgi:hypothetical protein